MSAKENKLSGTELETMFSQGKNLCDCMTMGELSGKILPVASDEFWMVTRGYVPVDEKSRTESTDLGASRKHTVETCEVFRCRSCGETFEGPWETETEYTHFKDEERRLSGNRNEYGS